MPSGSQHLPDRSWKVVVRFCLKLAVFVIVCAVSTAVGGPNPFFNLTALASLLCIVLAVYAGEQPIGRSLTYWDEALVFGLVSQLG